MSEIKENTNPPGSPSISSSSQAWYEFWSSRGLAIQAYSVLECSLSSLLAHLSGMHEDVGEIIFFKITSTGARTSILEKLLKKKYGAAYITFWNSFQKLLGQVDGQRNELVHWTFAPRLNPLDKSVPEFVLIPPTQWTWDSSTPFYDSARILQFKDKCEFLANLCANFRIQALEKWAVGPGDEKTRQAWLDICQRPIDYPPPESHPLYRTPSTPLDPLLPLPASPPTH